ncbi:ameloblastin [Xenopus tropicalis]|uniref:Ameloblastin n=1 Tax=Xenopus tropicalis TaxID=8364 RepID=F7A2E2_XENTR|nr:ameloblastin [Xenopus tropicalis]|eukprot:XP_002938667.2 PREDICTED: ameloblastin [Xenopus tropicalis]
MEPLVLVLCLLSTAMAYPMHPQAPGTQGLASISLETMRQQQAANTLTAPFSQISRFGYNDPYSVLWLHGLLPPHSSYPWLHQRPQLSDNQQFEYALPIHPPPLPGAQSPAQTEKPGQHAQNMPQQPQAAASTDQVSHQPSLPLGFPILQQADPAMMPPKGGPADGQIQTVALYMYQTIMNKLLQQGAGETIPDPAGTLPVNQQHPYPGLFFMQYGGGPGGPPARLGAMSSEEITGGRTGAAHAFSSLYPGLLGMGPRLESHPQNPALQGDFTIEDDSPVAGQKPTGQEVSQGPIESPQGVGSSIMIPGLEGSPTGQGETVPFPNINSPNMGFNPQSKIPPGVTPANAPRLTHDTGAGYVPFALDDTMPFGIQRENVISGDITRANNAKGIESPIMQHEVHLQNHNNYFQEP